MRCDSVVDGGSCRMCEAEWCMCGVVRGRRDGKHMTCVGCFDLWCVK